MLTTNLVNKRYEEKRKECVYFMREILLKSLRLSKKCHLPIYLKFGVSINYVDIPDIYFLHFSRQVELYEASSRYLDCRAVARSENPACSTVVGIIWPPG